jgi:predicted MPP superfamily phosphohydrolase
MAILRVAHVGDVHLEEDHYFGDTAQCLEWFVADATRSNVDLFVINGDLTTYKQTIKERNLWIETLIQMGNHAPVILVAGNHGKELDGDLHVFVRAKASHLVYLCTEPEFIQLERVVVAVFPYPRKAEFIGTSDEHDLRATFAERLDELDVLQSLKVGEGQTLEERTVSCAFTRRDQTLDR